MRERKSELYKQTKLYGIKFTPAGPVPVRLYDASDKRYMEENKDVTGMLEESLMTFEEVKAFMCDWFINRAEKIEDLTEDKLINGEIPDYLDEETFIRYLDNKLNG